MKKNYILLSGIVLMASMSFAQNLRVNRSNDAVSKLESQTVFPKVQNAHGKAFLDTLFYEDFDTQIPAGWTTANNAGNANNWIWSNTAPGGQFSTTVTALNSTSGANGYMLIPADLYNTPIPTGGAINMDASFTSPMISPTGGFPASVLVRWQHAQRYCCSSVSSEMILEVSTDNITYTTFDATDGKGVNTASGNADEVEVNVSSVLGNATTGYLRFRMSGASHYYWMVDDVTILEGPKNSVILNQMVLSYEDTLGYVPSYDYEPPFYMYPQAMAISMFYAGDVTNYGSNTQTGVTINYQIEHDSTDAGNPGLGYVAGHGVTRANSLTPTSGYSEYVTPGFISTVDGYFRATVFVTSDSVNQNGGAPMPVTSREYDFRITDTIMGATAGSYLGDAGPGNYVGGGADGDRWCNLFTMGHTGAVATSVSYFVYTGSLVPGSQIQPRVYEWLGDTSTAFLNSFGAQVGGSPFTVTIDTSMQGDWLTIPLFPPVALSPNRKYLAGWEQIGGATSMGAEFSVFRNREREQFYDPVSPAGFMYITQDSRWYTSPQLGGIRLNFGNLTIGVEENEAELDFAVSPNPTTGELNIQLESNTAKTYRLNVRNMLGQVVHNDNVSVNGKKRINLDLSGNEKGVYFVTLENGQERLVRKVVLK